MRTLSVLVATLLPSLAMAADSWTTPHPGIRRLHRTTSSQNINVLVVDLCAPGVSVRATKSGERQRVVSSFASLVGAKAAINGDFFNFDTYSTTGPAIGEGIAWGGEDTTFVAPAQFGAHLVALPAPGGTAGPASWARQAVSGHPSLIVGGVKKDYPTYELCTTANPRTALGFTGDHKQLILAVVDGRATGRVGMTCAQLATLMAEFGADDAVNLDGGGSSTMWIAGSGVINYPSDGAERVVANHLAIRATGSGEAAHCPLPSYAATITASDAPLEMTSGEEATVWFELSNDGDVAWTPDGTRVGTQDPQDRESAFYAATWPAPNRAAAADQSYAPNATARFSWTMVAPDVDATTTFDETFQLVQEGVTWFGPKHTISIIVHPRDDDAGSSTGCSTTGSSSPLVLLLFALCRRRRAR